MERSHRAALRIAALAFSTAAGIAAAATSWTFVDIGTLGGPGSYGAALNDGGVVVGCADLPSGGSHAFAWQGGAMRDLDAGVDPAAGSSCALAVSGPGAIAGRSANGELVIWDGATKTSLGVKGNVGGINDSGVVVGSYPFGASTRAFLYTNGVVTNLGTLGGSDTDPAVSSSAASINRNGQVAGSSNGRAFLYQNGSMRDLGTLGGNLSIGKGINIAGTVVGQASNDRGQPSAFIFDTSMRALPGPGYSGATAINDAGQVVGSAEGYYGFLVEGTEVTRLDTLSAVVAKGWHHLEPTGINSRGWIVGSGTDAQGNLRAFLLVPGVPSQVVANPPPQPQQAATSLFARPAAYSRVRGIAASWGR